MLNHYKLLGISYDATNEQVVRSWRKKALLYHPDKNDGDEESALKFGNCKEAYDVLKDSHKRKVYDLSIGIAALKKKSQVPPIVKTTKDSDNERMGTGNLSVVIDPNGEVYVDISKMGSKIGVDMDFFKGFFG